MIPGKLVGRRRSGGFDDDDDDGEGEIGHGPSIPQLRMMDNEQRVSSAVPGCCGDGERRLSLRVTRIFFFYGEREF